MSVYVFETIDVLGAGRGILLDRIQRNLAPHLEMEFGIAMVGAWATAGSTANWPEANVLWEMEDWDDFGRAQNSRFPLEDKDPYGCELNRHFDPLRTGRHHALLVGASFSPRREELIARDAPGGVVLRENIRSRPDRFAEYQEALAEQRLPLALDQGLRLVGSYANALRPNQGMNLWSFRDWAHVAAIMEADAKHGASSAWKRRENELLEDIEGWLLAVPPPTALGT